VENFAVLSLHVNRELKSNPDASQKVLQHLVIKFDELNVRAWLQTIVGLVPK
jgi:hypothetical protein